MRRSFVAVALAVVAVGASTVQAKANTAAPPAQQAAAAAPAPAQAAPVADPLKFTGVDDVVLVIQVKQAGAADFESGFAAMLAALAKSTSPDLVAHGKSMTLSKVDLALPPEQPSLYVLSIHNPSKDLSYTFGLILFYSGKPQGPAYAGILPTQDEALAIYKKVQDSIVNINPWPLKKIGG